MQKEIIVDLARNVVLIKEDGSEQEIPLESSHLKDMADDEIKRLIKKQLIDERYILDDMNNYDIKSIIRN